MKEWITGRNPVYECLRANRRHFFRILFNRNSKVAGRLEEIYHLATDRKLAIEAAEIKDLETISDRHQGVALQVGKYSYCELDSIVRKAKKKDEPLFVLLLDQIQDVQNMGALIRTAEVFGVHGIILPSSRSADVTPAVVNASSGASEHALIARMNINQALDVLKDLDVWSMGLDMDESGQSLERINLSGNLAIVVGSEGSGLRRLVREKCDHVAYIPMAGNISSLNAAIAGSIALYKAFISRKT